MIGDFERFLWSMVGAGAVIVGINQGGTHVPPEWVGWAMYLAAFSAAFALRIIERPKQ
jgi:hypothetical protein